MVGGETKGRIFTIPNDRLQSVEVYDGEAFEEKHFETEGVSVAYSDRKTKTLKLTDLSIVRLSWKTNNLEASTRRIESSFFDLVAKKLDGVMSSGIDVFLGEDPHATSTPDTEWERHEYTFNIDEDNYYKYQFLDGVTDEKLDIVARFAMNKVLALLDKY